MKVNVYEAKTKLSALLKRAARGEEILIARDGAPVARLVPVVGGAPRSRLGLDEGAFTVPDDFNAPLLDDY